MTEFTTVSVGLGDRAYDIHIGSGLLPRAASLISPLLTRRKVAIVTDETVAGLHLETLLTGLADAGIAHDTIILPPGEATKDFRHLEHLCEELIRLEIERGDMIIALGGGVIGDITGFAAAILRRGCRFVQIPTTLLAQVDSSVGGKTAINARQGKNLIGAFHQPAMVLADIGTLATLPVRELRAGYAEVLKYGLLGDRAFFSWLEDHGVAVLEGDLLARTEAVRRSVEMKARIVEQDEKEGGIRALLNLGHTFGHALEAATGYSDRLLHGEAVALGSVLAFEFSAAEGLCPANDAAKARAQIAAAGLPVAITGIDGLETAAEELLALMYQDKKVADGKLTLILAHGIGDAFIARDANPQKLTDFLRTRL